MKTIVHYLSSDIKVNQEFKYRQITSLKKYRSIVIGDFAKRDSEKEYPYNYYYMGDIADWPSWIKKHRVKAIHAHIGGDAVKILPFTLKYKLPLIASFRGNDASAQKYAFKKNQLKYQEVMKHGSLFLPVCHFFSSELIKLGFPKEKVKVLHGGIDTKKFAFRKPRPKKNGAFKILSIGRLVGKKGFPVLIEAFRKVHEAFPKAKLIIIGKGSTSQRNKIRALIKENKLDNAITLKKPVKNGDIVKELHRADLFCLASFTTDKGGVEGIPNVLKEAMSCGVPVVSTFHAGIPELIEHNKTGILVGENDSEAMANAIRLLLGNPKLGQKYAKHARKKVAKDFNLKKQIKIQEQYYDQLLKKVK